ncbi:MAG: dihydrofolate reductase family protein [Alphaproteobacteria bacterium]
MRHLVYDVASSLDGYIAAPGDDISAFPMEGDHAAAYQARLEAYDTVVMGRRTYEFGYGFGLKVGARAYPHMRHCIFSRTISFPGASDVEVVRTDWLQTIDAMKSEGGTDIYLCGGGRMAGYLLQHGRIDRLIVKLAPIILGSGVALFEGMTATTHLTAVSVTPYKNGVTLMEYQANLSGCDPS